MTESKLILALDGMKLGRALELAETIGPRLFAMKIHDLADIEGAKRACEMLKRNGAPRVWVDYKLHDTPDTVRNRACALRDCGADILTVHVGDDGECIRAARESGLIIYGVTVLTSTRDIDLSGVYGENVSRSPLAKSRAYLAGEFGAHGVICSSADVKRFKSYVGTGSIPSIWDKLEFIVPGTRLPGGDTHDQKNVTTPQEAFSNGASKLVVGRDLTKADDPETVLAAYEAARQ